MALGSCIYFTLNVWCACNNDSFRSGSARIVALRVRVAPGWYEQPGQAQNKKKLVCFRPALPGFAHFFTRILLVSACFSPNSLCCVLSLRLWAIPPISRLRFPRDAGASVVIIHLCFLVTFLSNRTSSNPSSNLCRVLAEF